MAGRTSAEVKQRLLQELNHARVELQTHSQLAREELSPAALVSKTVAQHKLAWIIGGTVTGLLLIRIILPAKNRSDNSSRPDKTSWLSGIFKSVASTLAKRAATQLASHYLKDSTENYLTSLFQRPGPPPP
jgi:hypothetical protein